MIRRFLASLTAAMALVSALVLSGAAATAQSGNPFAPAVLVNGSAVTNFEIEQRVRMMELFRTPGDLHEQALEALIDDRLRLQAAKDLEVEIPEEDITAGMEEFAQRANMGTQAFVAELGRAGVSQETFRDFVTAGIAWRAVVRKKYGQRAAVSEPEAQDALRARHRPGKAAVVMAEIVLPARDPEEAAGAQALAAELQKSITTPGAFAAAAREYSAAPSAANGGRLDRAVPLEELPPPIRAQVMTMAPGEVTEPLTAPNAVAVFQLVELRDLGKSDAGDIELEFASYLIPGGHSQTAMTEAGKIVGRVDTCTDLYGVNKGQDPRRLTVETLPVAQIPGDVAMELAKLDEGEISTALTRGDNLLLLMLCSRNPIREEAPNLTNVQNAVFNQRLAGYGEGYLAELRANAMIRYP